MPLYHLKGVYNMKVVIFEREYDYNQYERMEIDGKQALSVVPCEPEDAILGRDLISCHEIYDLMAKAHLAGLRGESLELAIEADDD